MISRCLCRLQIQLMLLVLAKVGCSKKLDLLNLLTMLARAVSSTICSKSELGDARSLGEQK